MTIEIELDAQRQEKAREYARLQRRLMVVDLAFGLIYLLTWLLTGWSQSLKTCLQEITSNEWLLVALFGLVVGGLFSLLNLPLSFYEGYILPKRFELSTQTLQGWITDQVKMALLGGALALILLETIYAVLRAFPTTWWLWAAGIMLFFNVLLANLAPVLIFPLFYKFQPLGEEHANLEKRLFRLAEKARTRIQGVFKFDMSQRTRAANAALTGLGNTRRIILGDTLLNEFSDDEIEVILAHELAHHVHKDIPVGILLQSLVTLVGFYLTSLGLSLAATRLGFTGASDIAALPLLILFFGAYGLITTPILNAYLRWRERRADAYALQATGNGQAFISAMTRLANQNLAEIDPPEWEEFLFGSHPALRKRIEAARDYMAQSAPITLPG
jgi:STE24 endopeptidase